VYNNFYLQNIAQKLQENMQTKLENWTKNNRNYNIYYEDMA